MDIKKFSDLWINESFDCINQWKKDKSDTSHFTGFTGSSPSFLLANIFKNSNGPVFILAPNSKEAGHIADECKSLVEDPDSVLIFQSRDAIPYNMKSPFGPSVESRFRSLSKLMNGEKFLCIAPCETLIQQILPQRQFFNKIIRLHVGDDISQTTLATWLTENGFHRETAVENLGSFAIRGDIFDIYPFITKNPIRLEFWGDTIESIRMFDIFTQKSQSSLKDIEIFPMTEFSFSENQIDQALENITNHAKQHNIDTSIVRKLEHSWKSTTNPEGIEWYIHWFMPEYATIIDYLPQNATIVWNDILPIERRLNDVYDNYTRHLDRVPDLLKPIVSPPKLLLADYNQIQFDISTFNTVFINTESENLGDDYKKYNAKIIEQPFFPKAIEPLIEDLTTRHKNGFEINVLCANNGHAQRFLELVSDPCPFVKTYIASIDKGFIDLTSKKLFYSENQIFSRPHYRPIKHRKIKAGDAISSFDALYPGDYVVHIDHGIAQFVGIKRISAGKVQQDCMVLNYNGASKLYVPVEDFSKIQKYISKDGIKPTLSKLGSSSWNKIKERTKKELKEMASELIELYAKREYMEGIKFDKDNLWQKEFEDTFLFDETPDQLKAINDVKKDMESKKPMDRLVCGDVGFGKTEVALRAAFKAVSNGYQAAILAPTTILVAQHFETFKERLTDFPIKIEMLSRFVTPKKQRKTVENLKNGTVDIVVSTHRLLSKDIKFKNLGILIVDEEQRFGVRAKEKLKQYRYKVDVLSMTATPIPRTLHLSLLGARDLSIISTPPTNRLPVETHVMEQHDEIFKTAIENELERGGQVYVVHNRIKNLYLLAELIDQLVPKARVIVAHGQMNEKELQKIMKEFVAGKFDVLLSTVIIENGLDIPNVNTMIVNRADTMGLSQLYQLRGRVGRSSEQAYAYFLVPSFKQIKEVSLKRLKALEQYTDLGSGFQIAMRDLEIRGAGNILGTKQHGFISAVGFEMYCKLLKEAVAENKGEPPEITKNDVKIDISIEAYLPSDYIKDPATRVSLYQQLSSISTISEIDDLSNDLADRFGALPSVIISLLLLMKIRILAQKFGISKINVDVDNKAVFYLDGENDTVSKKMKEIISKSSRNFEIAYGTPLLMKTKLGKVDKSSVAIEIFQILDTIQQRNHINVV